MLLFIYAEYNKIEEVGCEAIVKANWPNLTDLSLRTI
jgi:hypothetical protein